MLAGLVTALPGTGTVWFVTAIFLDYQPFDLSGILRLYAQVFVLHLIIGSLVFHLVNRLLRQQDTSVESSPPDDRVSTASYAEPDAALLARLPARSRAELLHLRMQDHYVEVHTAAGSELLLLRFRDALREVEDINGLQVHRSHWVARDAVVGVEAAWRRPYHLAPREWQQGSGQPLVRSRSQDPGVALRRIGQGSESIAELLTVFFSWCTAHLYES